MKKFFYLSQIVIYSFFSFLSFSSETGSVAQLPEKKSSINFLDAILSANIIVQIAFVILIVMSVISWAIIFQKWQVIKRVKNDNLHWENIFSQTRSFEEINRMVKSQKPTSLSYIFNEGYSELKKVFNYKEGEEEDTNKSQVPSDSLYNIERSLKKAINNEISGLEHGLSFLATTGNSCPFIGLFGTVFGIMDSFSKIASMGSASLSVVAPGISEALIATGLGLFAAIPASVFYNNFVTELKKMELEFDNFSSDFLNIAQRNFFNTSDKNENK